MQLGAGRIYALESLDLTAYGALAADTAHQIIKQGILLDPVTLSTPAPTTAGYSVDYLIEVTYADQDGTDQVLQYYNQADPQAPLNGPGGAGTAQATQRLGKLIALAKPGVPAATGTQTAPSADAGYVGLYIVTVAYGQTTVTASNIAQVVGAPFITGALLSQATADQRYLQLTGGTLSGPLTVNAAAAVGSLTVNGTNVNSAGILTSGLLAAARLGTGTANSGAYLRGDGSWQVLSFAALSGSIANNQVPVGAVTQFQANLSINGAQISGSIAVNGTITAGAVGYASEAGDLSAARGSGGSGVLYLGSANTYLYFSGSAYVMPGYPIQAGGFQVTSDRNLKKNIRPIRGALGIVRKLRGMLFDWRATNEADGGLIAQHLQRHFPVAVSRMKLADGRRKGPLTANPMPLIGLLFSALNDAADEHDQLKARVSHLEKRLSRLSR